MGLVFCRKGVGLDFYAEKGRTSYRKEAGLALYTGRGG